MMLSIGMPVYNCAEYIKDALDCAIKQTVYDKEIIISDNASTDATSEICMRAAKDNAGVRYYRQASNIGPEANFKFVLDKANGDMFCWMSSDDIRSYNFCEANVALLSYHPEAVVAVSPTRFKSGKFDPERMGYAPLLGDVCDRFEDFFSHWHANAFFHGVMRTSILKQCQCVGKDFLGMDWTTVLHMARHGYLLCSNAGWLVLGERGLSNSSDRISRQCHGALDFMLPFNRLTRYVAAVSKEFPVMRRAGIMYTLARYNVAAFKTQLRFTLSRIAEYLI